MPSKQTGDCGQLRKRLRLLTNKMTGSKPVSPYKRMDVEKKMDKKVDKMDKENNNLKEVGEKKQKKKRSWKRFRQIAFTTCRYIGLGVAHMSPYTVSSGPDYGVDPKYWNRSFSHTYQQRAQNVQHPHWSSNMMFATTW